MPAFAKLCECGCGQPPAVASRTSRTRGSVRGESLRFVVGHQNRSTLPGPNPSGLCMCGCGQRTKTAAGSDLRYDQVRGTPKRFLSGHQTKGRKLKSGPKPRPSKAEICAGGYRLVRAPEHPRAHRGYVRGHRLVAEEALGKALPAEAVVHHVNGVRDDNRPGNLVICQDAAYHQLLHLRLRALRACGHADWRWCGFCREWGAPEMAEHVGCGNAARRAAYARRRGAA